MESPISGDVSIKLEKIHLSKMVHLAIQHMLENPDTNLANKIKDISNKKFSVDLKKCQPLFYFD